MHPSAGLSLPKVDLDTRVVVLTGAGMSAESGVPTFRGPDGLWRRHRPEDLATPDAFARDPTLVWQWYDWRRQTIAACAPHAGHRALVDLERSLPQTVVVTQNVDGLHGLAGSCDVVELHGSIWRLRCTACAVERDDRDPSRAADLPTCPACGALERPAVVWFGEPLDERRLHRAFAAARAASIVLVIGTSGAVQPAASLPLVALEAGACVIEINPQPTPLTQHATLAITAPAVTAVPTLVEAMMRGNSR